MYDTTLSDSIERRLRERRALRDPERARCVEEEIARRAGIDLSGLRRIVAAIVVAIGHVV